MASAIDFYFDFSSPYGYFASTRIDELAAKYGRDVEWHPILLGVVFKTTGSAPLPLIPMKGDYSRRDFERTARFHQIPYQEPTAFPIPTQAAARAMLWVQSKAGDDRAIEFAKALFHAYFVDNRNVGDPETVIAVGTALGFDSAALTAGMNSAAVKDQLRAETDLAMAKGVFGSPYVIVDGEPFWGFDRFDQIEALLRDGKI
jgi:2-hydroxychromene-2-carboxylate isomerase